LKGHFSFYLVLVFQKDLVLVLVLVTKISLSPTTCVTVDVMPQVRTLSRCTVNDK